jgi:hypothetical protein
VVIELFGPGVAPLRAVAAVAALGSELALYGVALRFMSQRWALAAAGLLMLGLGVPFWEGNLALTETFVLLPTLLAVLCTLVGAERRGGEALAWWLTAGLLFGIAVLIRQTAGVVALSLVVWFLFGERDWLRLAMCFASGSLAMAAPVLAAFAVDGSFYWFWNANVGFFLQYVPSGEQLPFHYRPLIVLPVLVCTAVLAFYARAGHRPRWGLPALWFTLTLAAALLTGRPYSHYFLQSLPPLSLLLVLIAAELRPAWRPRWSQAPALALAASVLALWFGVVVPQFSGQPLAMRYTKGPTYYANFAAWSLGLKSDEAYNDYFDRRVNLTHRLERALDDLGGSEDGLFIWGEYPWVYALTDSRPATRYMTSFYTLLIPYLDTRLAESLYGSDPRLIVVTNDVWPKYYDETGMLKRRYERSTRALNTVLAERYELALTIGRARVFRRTTERAVVTAQPAPLTADQDDEVEVEGLELGRR